MLDVRAVGSDLTPAQKDEVMTDLAFFLDEFGSTRAVCVKLQEQESEIERLRRLLSQETQQDTDTQKRTLSSSEEAVEDVDDIMADLSYFLGTFGSTRAVRERLENQKQEIAALQRATQWVLDARQIQNKSDESRGAVRESAEPASVHSLSVNERRLDNGQVTQEKATDEVREGRDGGDTCIDSGDEHGAGGEKMKSGSVNSEDVDIIRATSQPEKTNQTKNGQSDRTNFDDRVAKADVIVRDVEIEIVMPSIRGRDEHQMTEDQIDSVHKADHTTAVSVGPVKVHGGVTTSQDVVGQEHPEQGCGRHVQSPNKIMSLSSNFGESGETVTAYYKFLKSARGLCADSTASPIGKLCGSSGFSHENAPQENINGNPLRDTNQVEGASSKSTIVRRPRSSSWKSCRYPGCTKNVQAHGLCCRHGGYHICKAEGCTRRAVTKYLCRRHGGGTKCRFEGCDKLIASGCKGYCCGHARAIIGYRKSMVEGATSVSSKIATQNTAPSLSHAR